MKAEIITIGNEILIGQIVDTNSTWLASQLVNIGFSVSKITSISDTKKAIEECLEEGLKKSDLLVFTGGLGPTNDDVTKKVLADYFHTPLIHSEEALSDVKDFLQERGGKLNDLNYLQATIPQKAEILHNRQGTAPGLLFRTENKKIVLSLPGVPSEMKGIMQQYGLEVLKKAFDLPFNYFKTLMIIGIAESDLAEKIAVWEQNLPKHISLAYLPSLGIIRLRLGATGKDELAVKYDVEKYVKQLYKIIPNLIFGENNDSLEQIISSLLKEKGLTLSTAESCTAGSIAKRICSISGSSGWYKGGVVAYSNQVKQELLNVATQTLTTYGAVSEQAVIEMAENACKLFKTDCSIAISGIAGPTGGSPEKPVGTVWVAIICENKKLTQCFYFGKERLSNIEKATLNALNQLRLLLKKS